MSDGGYFRVYRKIIGSRVWQDAEMLKIWLFCLAKAGRKERWVSIKTGRGTTSVHLMPGQFVFGRKSAAKRLKMSPSSVRNRILRLQRWGNVAVKNDTHHTIVTVINWTSYQTKHSDTWTPKSDTQPQKLTPKKRAFSKNSQNLDTQTGHVSGDLSTSNKSSCHADARYSEHPKVTGNGQASNTQLDTNNNVLLRENVREKEIPIGISCPETASPSSVPQPPEPAVLVFPTDGRPNEWPLTPSLVSELSELFPALDVADQARQALAWVRANPEKRKTASGMRRFLTNWLSRSQNRGTPRAKPPPGAEKCRAPTDDDIANWNANAK